MSSITDIITAEYDGIWFLLTGATSPASSTSILGKINSAVVALDVLGLSTPGTVITPTSLIKDVTVPVEDANGNITNKDFKTTAATELAGNLLDAAHGLNGIPAVTEAAIFSRGLARQTQVLNETLDIVTERWGASGAPLPDGVLVALTQAEIDKYSQARSDLNSALTQKSLELAAEFAKVAQPSLMQWYSANIHEGIAQNIAAASLTQKDQETIATVTLEYVKMRLDRAKTDIEAVVREFQTTMSTLNVQLSAHDAYSTAANKTDTVAHTGTVTVTDSMGAVSEKTTYDNTDTTTEKNT